MGEFDPDLDLRVDRVIRVVIERVVEFDVDLRVVLGLGVVVERVVDDDVVFDVGVDVGVPDLVVGDDDVVIDIQGLVDVRLETQEVDVVFHSHDLFLCS